MPANNEKSEKKLQKQQEQISEKKIVLLVNTLISSEFFSAFFYRFPSHIIIGVRVTNASTATLLLPSTVAKNKQTMEQTQYNNNISNILI